MSSERPGETFGRARGPERGLLVVLSAPSGTGKTTVAERLVEVCDGLERSRSFTSRPARPGERDGVDYNFVSRALFEDMARRGDLLEWADVFGNLYGTGRQATETVLGGGRDVLLVIDVQGARQVRSAARESVSVFLLPPSFQALETRLRGRSKDGDAAIERRLNTARTEIAAVEEYDYVTVNDDLERCVADIAAIVRAERLRRMRRARAIEPIVRTFRSAP
jgi:guanylate kinase